MKIPLVCVATLFFSLPAAASTIVVNGSFEAGVPGNVTGNHNGQSFDSMPGNGGWDIWQNLVGWSTVSGDGIEIQTNGTIGEVDAQDGQYYVELDARGNSVMEQIVMLAKGSYLLSFWYSPRSVDSLTNGIEYSLGDLLDGVVVGPSERQNTAVGLWTLISSPFIVTEAGTYALRFGAIGTSNGYGGLIDNISITVEEPAAVPVPAAGLLLLGGLGALGALRRRKG